MKITFVLDKQTIRRTDSNTVVAGSRDYLYAHFALASPDWIAPITAIFGNKTVILNDDGDCKVPWEVIEHPGAFSVSAFCVSVHTAQGVMVPVEETPYDPGETPPDPSPDVYTQLTQMVQEALDTANSVREDANAGEFNGAPGPVGPYYEPNVDDAGDISWENNGGLPNPPTKNIKGPKGDAATIEISGTETGNPGTDASVVNEGTKGDARFRFTIPRGDEGKAATIEVGKVTASDPGSKPQVTNAGTENAAVLDFVLPRGQTGPTGQAATVEVESTITGQPGTQANVENVGTTGAARLRFTIPRGDTGENGVTPTLSAGNVETLEPDQPATASVTGEGPAYQINLGIPRGQTGAQGTPGQNGEDGQTPTISLGSVTTLDPGQEATAEITGETPNLTLNLGIPQGQPGQDGVQLNDNAVNTTEAWSSKKIVDTLCPPFAETGNPITCNPVEDYPLDVTVTMEPIQEGTGDPSPENVRPISGRSSVRVTVSNEDESRDYTLTLPETIYGGTVDAVSGVGEKTWEFMEFDGTENWLSYNNSSDVVKTFYVDIGVESYKKYINILCDRASFLHSTWNKDEPWTISSSSLSNAIYISVPNDVASTVEQWKSYLAAQASAGTPVQVAYKLATPKPFQATGNQPIPALAGENTVYTDGNSLAVSGRSDPLSTIQTMQAQITALQDQATQGGTA